MSYVCEKNISLADWAEYSKISPEIYAHFFEQIMANELYNGIVPCVKAFFPVQSTASLLLKNIS